MGSEDVTSDNLMGMEERIDQQTKASDRVGLVSEAGSVDVGVLVGRYVSKETPGVKREIVGKVVSYDPGSGMCLVVYEDGNQEGLDCLQVSNIVIAEDNRVGSNMKLSCRKRKLDLLLSSGSGDPKMSPPRTKYAKKNASDVSDGAETSSVGRLDSDLSEDADSSSTSCGYMHPPPVECRSIELPPSSSDIAIPEESISHFFSVYSFLRSFSVQLYLSPFRLDEFVGSLNCMVQNSLIDAIHLQLIRALRRHLQMLSSEGLELASKCLRHYDWSLLDALTWPAFIVEYLYIMGYMASLVGKGYGALLSDGEYYGLPVNAKLRILQILCDDVVNSAELRTELETRENIEDDAEADSDLSLPSDNGPRNVQSRSYENPDSKNLYALRDSKQIPSSKATESITVASSADVDGNSDECLLCGMDGTLICCDGCPSAYHSRCIGLSKSSLPPGKWFCPECLVDKLSPTSFRVGRGIKGAEPFGIDVSGRLFLGTCNYLLVTGTLLNEEPFSRYYNQSDVNKVLSLMSSVAENSSPYAFICNEISKYWEVSATTLEVGQTKPTGGNQLQIDRESSSNFEARPHSYTLNSTNQSIFPNMQESNTSNANVAIRKTELGMLGTVSSLNSEQISSKISSETVQHISPDTHTIFIGKESSITTMPLSKLPSAVQRLGPPDFSSCISSNENVICGGDAGSSFIFNKNYAIGAPDGSRYGSQVKNDRAPNSRVFFSRHSYVNQYIHGDIAASAAANLAVLTNGEKGFSEGHISSKLRKAVSMSIALQMKAFSEATMYFLWPTFDKKLLDIPRERCGWCIACKGSMTTKRGCLLNLAAANSIKNYARNNNGLRPSKHYEFHYPVIAAHIANMEEALHGLLVGLLLDAHYNLQWRKQVQEASSCRILKKLLLELERNIRGIAFSGAWFKLINSGSPKFSTAPIGTSRSGPSQKRGPGRRSKKQIALESASESFEDSWKDVQWWRGGKLSKFILQSETLPSFMIRKAARQGGFRRIPSICYPESVELPRRSRQFAWRAAVEMCKNVSQLALQVRCLDAHIRWRDLIPLEQTSLDGKGSDGDALVFRNVVICDKRSAANKIMYALTFSNQKHIPSRVMKNVLEKENINSESSKFWFSENHIPLYLVKDYEEKIVRKLLLGSVTLDPHVQPKFQKEQVKFRRRDIFSYLLHGGDKSSCAACKEDVNLRDATICSICQGKCHKDCAIPLIDRKGASLSYNITCKICYHAKTAALNPSRKEILNGQLSLQSQGRLMSGNKFMPQMVAHTLEPTVKMEVNQGTRSLVSRSKPEDKVKRVTCHSFGLLWKKKKGTDTGKDFRLENILLRSEKGINPLRRPTCCLCHSPYCPDLMYIRCEKCLNWFHADALNLKEAQIFDLVGFKCCRCRRKASPKCPYSNPDFKKPTLELIDNGITREGSMSDSSILVHSSNQISSMVDEVLVVANGDPLLDSFEIVEPLLAQTSGAEHPSESRPLLQSQPKLSVRRPHIKDTTGLCFESQSPGRNNKTHSIDDYHFVTENDKSFPSFSDVLTSYDFQESGSCGTFSVNDTDCDYQWDDQMCENVEDAEYEPQTYFSFTELLASDDGQLDALSDGPVNVVDVGWPSSCGELGPEEVHSAVEELGNQETGVHRVACDICKLDDPPPTLTCEICAQTIHSYCSPWVESEEPPSDVNWRCGRCRDWR